MVIGLTRAAGPPDRGGLRRMWQGFWKAVVWAAPILYFGVAADVAGGGVGDIKRLLKRMGQARPGDRDGE